MGGAPGAVPACAARADRATEGRVRDAGGAVATWAAAGMGGGAAGRGAAAAGGVSAAGADTGSVAAASEWQV